MQLCFHLSYKVTVLLNVQSVKYVETISLDIQKKEPTNLVASRYFIALVESKPIKYNLYSMVISV